MSGYCDKCGNTICVCDWVHSDEPFPRDAAITRLTDAVTQVTAATHEATDQLWRFVEAAQREATDLTSERDAARAERDSLAASLEEAQAEKIRLSALAGDNLMAADAARAELSELRARVEAAESWAQSALAETSPNYDLRDELLAILAPPEADPDESDADESPVFLVATHISTGKRTGWTVQAMAHSASEAARMVNDILDGKMAGLTPRHFSAPPEAPEGEAE